MNADRTVALYRQLRHVFPAGWRRHHEAEFIETLHDDARSGSTPFPVRLADLLGLASLFMLLTLIGFVFYALIGALVSRWAAAAPGVTTWTQRAFGALLLGFAARLAVAER